MTTALLEPETKSAFAAKIRLEVIEAGVVKPGTNVFSCESSSDDYTFV